MFPETVIFDLSVFTAPVGRVISTNRIAVKEKFIINEELYELMPIDRKPEFFKGAQLKVGIIGCGYVGLPLALRFAEAGHKVTGFDTDPKKIAMLNAGKSYIEHIQQTKIQQFVNSKHFGATTDFAELKECDAIIICVPTPLDERREPDLSYVENTALSDPAATCKKASSSFWNPPPIPAPPKNSFSPFSKKAA